MLMPGRSESESSSGPTADPTRTTRGPTHGMDVELSSNVTARASGSKTTNGNDSNVMILDKSRLASRRPGRQRAATGRPGATAVPGRYPAVPTQKGLNNNHSPKQERNKKHLVAPKVNLGTVKKVNATKADCSIAESTKDEISSLVGVRREPSLRTQSAPKEEETRLVEAVQFPRSRENYQTARETKKMTNSDTTAASSSPDQDVPVSNGLVNRNNNEGINEDLEINVNSDSYDVDEPNSAPSEEPPTPFLLEAKLVSLAQLVHAEPVSSLAVPSGSQVVEMEQEEKAARSNRNRRRKIAYACSGAAVILIVGVLLGVLLGRPNGLGNTGSSDEDVDHCLPGGTTCNSNGIGFATVTCEDCCAGSEEIYWEGLIAKCKLSLPNNSIPSSQPSWIPTNSPSAGPTAQAALSFHSSSKRWDEVYQVREQDKQRYNVSGYFDPASGVLPDFETASCGAWPSDEEQVALAGEPGLSNRFYMASILDDSGMASYQQCVSQVGMKGIFHGGDENYDGGGGSGYNDKLHYASIYVCQDELSMGSDPGCTMCQGVRDFYPSSSLSWYQDCDGCPTGKFIRIEYADGPLWNIHWCRMQVITKQTPKSG